MELTYYTTFRFLLFGVCLAAVVATSCSPAERTKDAAHEDACLLAIRTQMFDRNAYWFGTPYKTNCPSGPVPDDVFCENPRSNEEDSMAFRLFPTKLDHKLIDRFLEVTYTSGEGSYDGCGTTVTEPAVVRDVDPLSPESFTPWITRHKPSFKFNSSDSQYYTIIFMNVGFLVPHAVYTNVEDNTITEENTILEYDGPLTPYLRREPFTFLVFKQSGRVSVSDQWKGILNSSSSTTFILEDFVKDYSLTGPVAVSLMTIMGDLYAAGLSESRQWIYTCPQFVNRALNMHQNSYLPTPVSLSITVDVEFQAPALSFNVCCTEYDYLSVNYSANLFSNKTTFTGTVRTEANLVFSFRKDGYYRVSNQFGDDMYTLISVDPDTPVPIAGTKEKPILHQLVTNIKNGNITTGDVVASYSGPSPPDPTIHNYWFLLYKQNGSLDATQLETYAGSCPTIPRLMGRCLFDINKLVQDNNLTLVGANVVRSTFDKYVQYRRLDYNDTAAVTAACGANFDPTCPPITDTDSASTLSFTGAIATCLLLLFVVFM